MRYYLSILLGSILLSVFAQEQQGETISNGAGSNEGSIEAIHVLGDQSGSNLVSGGTYEMYTGFIGANFITREIIEGNNELDSLALVSFYLSASDSSWTNRSNWLDGPIDTWFGVTVENKRVTGLQLSENNLRGFIGDSLGMLFELRTLDLSGNHLERGLPPTFQDLKKLKFLRLNGNDLSGVLPDLSANTNLVEMNLADNEFLGEIPSTWSEFDSLRIIKLASNQLVGPIPEQLGQVQNLTDLDVSDNQLSGAVPPFSSRAFTTLHIDNNQLSGDLGFLGEISSLVSVDISNNEFVSVPSLSLSVFTLNFLDVSGNRLDFGSIEPNINIQGFVYSPQATIGQVLDSLMEDGNPIQLFLDVGGEFNSYQWFLDDQEIADANSDTYSIPAIASEDEGEYTLQVVNSEVPDLTLISETMSLSVSSFERDRLSLIAIYEETGGDNWSNSENWLDDSVPLDQWVGVGLNSDGTRVESLDLSGNNLTGPMPVDLKRIGNLVEVDVSGNELERFPDITSLKDITSLDVSSNNLSFADLLPNVSINTYEYGDQGMFGEPTIDTVWAGDDFALLADMPGRFNQYQWYFNEAKVDGAALPLYLIESIDFFKMGDYHAKVSNDQLPDLTIDMAPKTVYAADDIFGVVSDSIGQPITGGEIDIFRIQDGPFDSAGRSDINERGEYLLKRIVLGDFILKVDPSQENDNVLQTYYISADDWLNADTLLLRQKTEGINITMITNPGTFEENPENTGIIGGVLEEEISDDFVNGRIETRRRVKKAGCSLRRKTQGGGGRTENDDTYELVAYLETDDNGVFNFANIPDGEYRLNIQYPGVPMDESSSIDFIIGQGGDIENNSFQLEAVITESGITVEVVEELGNLKPYLKDVWLYPNPAVSSVLFDYRVYRKLDRLELKVVDISGNTLMSKKIPHAKGTHSISLDVGLLAPGSYFIRLVNDDERISAPIKLIKK